ncbi:MAG: Rpn family recombination-promoting nuclease/putative transposase, partial [Burkholderiales bacterium]|nr:Rpn family recombination-promoting nuclease/putative transposase [Burkholderiales bacterium]
MENKPLSPKYDVVFKAIFGEESNVAILADFLEAVLELPKEEYEEIVIIDPHLLRETKADKLGILDLRIKTTHGHQISVEIQVSPQAAIWKRMQYYNARLLTSQIASGEAYTKINCAISVL